MTLVAVPLPQGDLPSQVFSLAFLVPLKWAGRRPCLGRFLRLLLLSGAPSICIAGLMESLPPVAELSACQARGPPEDDKRAFCLQALSSLLWGGPSRLRGAGGRQRGEREGGSFPLPMEPVLPGGPGRIQVASQPSDKACLGMGVGGVEGEWLRAGSPGGWVAPLGSAPRKQRLM